jgi:RNA polymerase sigma-70 factor, ECF subfamily
MNELISRAKTGDLHAFSELVQAHQKELLAFALYRIPNHEEAVEAVQDTFVRAYHQLAEFDSDGSFGTWLRAICRYMILSRAKTYSRQKVHQNRYQAQIDQLTAHYLADAEPDSEIDLLAALKTCTTQLSESNQQLLQQRYTEQLSIREISEQIGRTETWVTSTLHRVRSALRTCIEKKESRHE